MKILITHPSGNRNFQYLAKSICFNKKHNIIFTSLNINTDNIYIKLLPKKFKNLLEARNYSKFKSTVQSLQPIYELIRLFLSRTYLGRSFDLWKKFFSENNFYKKFDEKSSKLIDKLNIQAVYAYEGSALETFKVAKKKKLYVFMKFLLITGDKKNIF